MNIISVAEYTRNICNNDSKRAAKQLNVDVKQLAEPDVIVVRDHTLAYTLMRLVNV